MINKNYVTVVFLCIALFIPIIDRVWRPVVNVWLPYFIVEDRYNKIIEDKINALRPGQLLILHINSMGGSVYEAELIEQAIRGTKGEVVVQVEGAVVSAALDIALTCKTINFSRTRTAALFHRSFSFYEDSWYGKHYISIKEMTVMTPEAVKLLKKEFAPINTEREQQFVKNCKILLTPKEYGQVFVNNKDVVVFGKDMSDRLNKAGWHSEFRSN